MTAAFAHGLSSKFIIVGLGKSNPGSSAALSLRSGFPPRHIVHRTPSAPPCSGSIDHHRSSSAQRTVEVHNQTAVLHLQLHVFGTAIEIFLFGR